MRILLTGASGFVGQALLGAISARADFSLLALVRSPLRNIPANVTSLQISGLGPDADLHSALQGIDAVIHSAARVHVMQDAASDPLEAFRRINTAGTLNLARQAATAGVRRFIFISSVKVNGEGTPLGAPYTADAEVAPVDTYSISKMEAEQGLRFMAAETGMDVVIIRPVLVYGPGVKANFQSMMNWLQKGIPLPLGSIHNKRSLVALDNLVDLIVTCITHPAAANQTFMVSDGEDLSTTELLSRMGAALHKPARLLPIPSWVLEAGATALGKKALSQRLCGSLQVDISKTRELLNWYPPVSVDEALRRTANYFLEQRHA